MKESNKKSKRVELLICSCSSKEHQIIIDNDEDEVYVSVHLVHRSFFKRLIYGIKYIFGYKCRYGNFEEFILDKSHIKQLERVIFNIKNNEKN